MTDDRIDALRKATEANPDDDTLLLIYAESLQSADRTAEALDAYETMLRRRSVSAESLVAIGQLAAGAQRLDLARGCLEAARQAGVVEGVGQLQRVVDEMLAARGAARLRVGGEPEVSEWSARTVEATTFDQVGGMAEVKRVLHRMIILPLGRPELYARYGRQAGGGVLLHGPPGCGKTLIARAVAGECGLPFVNVRIEDVLDPYLGMSERNLHTAFETARAQAPCVLFLDELDALAYARHKHLGSEARRLVDVLLQELDAIGSDNSGLLVLAATNAPWDIDEAMLRPGRFDRVIFVPPPDEPARREIVEVLLRGVPCDGVSPAELASLTPLFSGADLRALLDRGIDQVIEEALATGTEPPLRPIHLMPGISAVRPSTLGWLRHAQAYVDFANQSERYTDIAGYLNTREIRRRLAR